MRALLVDDERLARARLRTLLSAHPAVTVVGEADSIDAAGAAIAVHAPDLIFLDVVMPGGSGLELLSRVRVDAHVVFVTAWDAHAVRAFEVGAVDYLLKPVEPPRLAAALARLRARAPAPDRIAVREGSTLRVVPVAAVVLARARGDYSELVLEDGTRIVKREPLAHWEARLGPRFARVHRGTLVSLDHLERLEPADGSTYRVWLRGRPEPVAVSRPGAAALRARLGGRVAS